MRIPKLYKCTRRREKRRDWRTDKNCLWLDLRSNWTPTNRQLLATLQLISVQLVHWSLGQITTSVQIRVVFEYKFIFFCLCEHIFQLIWNLNYSFIIGKEIYKYLACTQYGLIKIYSRLCLELMSGAESNTVQKMEPNLASLSLFSLTWLVLLLHLCLTK